MEPIETNRLIISEITLEDAVFMIELMNTESWLTYIGDRNVKTVEEAKTYLKKGILKSYAENGFGFYKLQINGSMATIGICGFVKRKELEDVDIGFGMLPQYEGKGYGYESASALMKYAETVLKLKRIAAITLPTNKNSINLLGKIGLTYEKTVYLFEEKEELLFFAKEF